LKNDLYLDFAFSVINIYGLYSNIIPFWEDLRAAGIFSDPLSVIEGDLNLTLSLRKVWGPSPKENRQRGFFLSFFESVNLIDMESMKLSPTWRNY